jgi:hypothetical protein
MVWPGVRYLEHCRRGVPHCREQGLHSLRGRPMFRILYGIKQMNSVSRNVDKSTYLRIAALTTVRTTAFMPALSPPEVKIAIFIVDVGLYLVVLVGM